MSNPALGAWGDYDRDDPYPLFAQVQADGPVHEVTLADGHHAWLIVRHGEAKAALNHADLSKDMHAALAREGVPALALGDQVQEARQCRVGGVLRQQGVFPVLPMPAAAVAHEARRELHALA